MPSPNDQGNQAGGPSPQGKDESLDALLAGRLKVLQSEQGYRFSIDSLLLAGFVHTRKNDRVADLGTGSGIVALLLARRPEVGSVTGVEIQEELADLAGRNVNLNGLAEKVVIRQGDIREIKTILPPESFQVAVFNPPYHRFGAGRINAHLQKSIARHEIKAALPDFLAAARHLLPHSGRVYAIYPASRMVELLYQLRRHRLEPKRLQLVHSRIDSPASFALVEGIKDAGEELAVAPPHIIYQSEGVYTAAMNGIFADLAYFK
ncbi:MAG: tRNA1(Val) (adenine(37)-N6)-methyltransferase [Smithellaceae bacterium]|nr:tRNA1(Val) (adenine(37)-N6)-methyltransferase [Smithellaceae bacterium]